MQPSGGSLGRARARAHAGVGAARCDTRGVPAHPHITPLPSRGDVCVCGAARSAEQVCPHAGANTRRPQYARTRTLCRTRGCISFGHAMGARRVMNPSRKI